MSRCSSRHVQVVLRQYALTGKHSRLVLLVVKNLILHLVKQTLLSFLMFFVDIAFSAPLSDVLVLWKEYGICNIRRFRERLTPVW